MISNSKCSAVFVGIVAVVLLVSVLFGGVVYPANATEDNMNSTESYESATDEISDNFREEPPTPPKNLEVHHYESLGDIGDKNVEMWETNLSGDDLYVYYPTEDSEGGYPALGFGHGIFQNPENFVSWGEHYASRGFVTAVPDLGTFYDDTWPETMLSALEFMKEKDREVGSPIEGKIAEDKMGLTGFSAGGEASINAAEKDTLEGRSLVKAIATMAPSELAGMTRSTYTDGRLSSSVNWDPENIEVPVQLQVGGEDKVVPQESVSRFYDDLGKSDEPSQFFVLHGADHTSYDGEEDASFQRTARKYTTPFFNYYLRGEEKYGEYPFGDFIEEDVEKGILDSNDYRNVKYTPSSGLTGFEHNKILWESSADDPDNVGSYNIYRSEGQNAPLGEPIGQVDADGSGIYSFVDEEKGNTDDIDWWYVVRAVTDQGEEENNTYAVQEPSEEPSPISLADPEPEDGATGIGVEAELSVLAEHEGGKNMNISFYDASDESLIGTETDVSSGERVADTWDGLDQETTYEWYAEADDGEETVRSSTWSFTTKDEAITYNELTINVEGEGSTDPSEGKHSYEEGTLVTVEATADEGWRFIEWTGDETCTDPLIDMTMDANKSITAWFEEVPSEEHELTITIDGEGATEPPEGTHSYEEGEDVSVTATPDEGYVFDEWTGIDKTGKEITIVMDEDKSITANFVEEAYFKVEITDHDEEVEEGEDIMVGYRVKNTGGRKGTQDIYLYIDGEEVKVESGLTLGADEVYEGNYTIEEDQVGDHKIVVSSTDMADDGTTTVEEDEGSFVSNYWYLIVVLLIGVIAIVPLMFGIQEKDEEE